jgi:hypothetical protein
MGSSYNGLELINNYSNQSAVGAGEKDPHVVREIVQEIARKARKMLNSREKSYDPGGLTDMFGWFSGSQAFSPFNYSYDPEPT